MSEAMKIPDFLRKFPPKETHMTTPTPTKAPKHKRRDCLNVTIKVAIPFSDRASLDAAYVAAESMAAAGNWPEGSAITQTASTGKLSA